MGHSRPALKWLTLDLGTVCTYIHCDPKKLSPLIFGTHYTELICNITIVDLPTSPTYCCCTTLQKKSVAKIITLPNTLHVLLYRLIKRPVYPHNQSALKILQHMCSKFLLFHSHRLKSLAPFINSIVHNALQ